MQVSHIFVTQIIFYAFFTGRKNLFRFGWDSVIKLVEKNYYERREIMNTLNKANIEKVKTALDKAEKVLVLTGAGISAESGVPTFRGGAGATTWRGMPFEVLSSAQMVEENLPLVWEWFDYRRSVVGDCHPNAAHIVLAEAQKSGKYQEFTLVTQNVDGLHAAAGSLDVLELHGNIWRARCLGCGELLDIKNIPAEERPPVCQICGDSMRPDIVLFGEMLPEGVFELAHDKAAECDICFVVGTSALVYPAASLPEIALQNGAFLVEVNPEETSFSSRANISLRGKAGEILPLIFSA